MDKKKYNFEVRYDETWWDTDDFEAKDQPGYVVCLPHQCDDWDITGGKDKDGAIKDLELFIKEAQGALLELITYERIPNTNNPK